MEIDCEKVPVELYFYLQEPNTSRVDISGLQGGFLTSSDIFSRLYCDYQCHIRPHFEECDLFVYDLSACSRKTFYFHSVFIKSDNAAVESLDYLLQDCTVAIRKYRKLQLLISLIPMTIALVLWLISHFDRDMLFILIGILCILVFPALRRIAKFRKICSQQNAFDSLRDAEIGLRHSEVTLIR